MEQLRQEVEQLIPICQQEWQQIESLFIYKQFNKGQVIHSAGDVFSQSYYIKSGLARSYLVDASGKELTWQLYFRDDSSAGNNHFLDDSVSHYEQEPSFLSFEVLEDSTFYMAEIAALDQLFSSDIKFEKLARMYLHKTFFSPMYKRALSALSEDATTRYKRLLKEQPNVFNKVKAYHIASYLGITPQTLSKIRKNELR